MEGDPVEKLRTIRHRENKRRYRARQREYVESLQQRLADTRDQQAAGMREVQLAAQKVVNDNSRLRALLRFTGVQDTVVESWLRGDETTARVLSVSDTLPPRSPISGLTPLSNQVSTTSTQTCSNLQHLPLPTGSYAGNDALGRVTSPPSEGTLSAHQLGSLQNKSNSSTLETSEESRHCMSVSHILAQPNIESRNVAELVPGGMVSGDVECSRAQKMVLPFATSNDKVDDISKKLKEGCVIDKCGGCKVKANVMWEILEDVMNEA